MARVCFYQLIRDDQLLQKVQRPYHSIATRPILTMSPVYSYWAMIVFAFLFLYYLAAGDAALLPLMASFASVMPQAGIQGFNWADQMYRSWRREVAASERNALATTDIRVENGTLP